MMRKSFGVSLVEVLVALALVSIALLAAHRAAQAQLHSLERQQKAYLAQICAENLLSLLHLGGRYPSVGQMRSSCTQMDQEFSAVLEIIATQSPDFRRVRVQVWSGQYAVLSVETMLGRY